ncbi:ATP-binding protein [Furfurilactobacillus curtus]|uniref:Membrane protein n=1 Tax=Furfurilactobacillus curtus TaxID=1746200 RepID=A0ABQ5JKP4_9LACO
MRLKQAHIDGFGKWQNQDFTFKESLQVIYGLNETGKTTLQRFILGVLFGFASGKRPAEQYLPKNGAGYGGFLIVATDVAPTTTYKIQRTAGKSGGDLVVTNLTLGQIVPSEELNRLLGSVDQAFVQQTLMFDLEDLRLLTATNGSALTSMLQRVGAVGSQHWLTVIDQLAKQSDEIYKSRGRKPALNQALQRYHQLQQELTTATAKYPTFIELQSTINAAEHHLSELVERQKQLRATQGRLQTAQRLWPNYEQYQQLQERTTTKSLQINEQDYTGALSLYANQQQLAAAAAQQVEALQDDSKDPTPELEFFMIHRSEFDQQAAKFDQVNAWINERHFKRQQLQNIKAEQQELDQRNQFSTHKMTPFSESEQATIQQHLASSSSITVTGAAVSWMQGAWPWFVAGAGLFLVSLLISSSLRWLLILIGIALVIYGWRRTQGGVYDSSSRNDDVSLIGQKHGFTHLPVTQWLGIQRDLTRWLALAEQERDLTEAIQHFNDQITHFLGDYDFANKWLSLRPLSASEALTTARHSYQRLATQAISEEAAQRRREQAVAQLAEIQTSQTHIERALTKLLKRLQMPDVSTLKQAYKTQLSDIKTFAQVEAIETQLTPALQQQLAVYGSKTAIDRELAQTNEALESTRTEITEQQQHVADLHAHFEQMGRDQQAPKLQQQVANQRNVVVSLAQNWLVNQLAMQWIDQTLTQASADRLPQIVAQAKQYFADLTLKHYTEIKLSRQQITVINLNGQEFELFELSRGTVEQLYLAIRLAFATIMNDQLRLPLMIDDAFVDFDQPRRKATVQLLERLAHTNQVLYFTADLNMVQDFEANQIIRLISDESKLPYLG